MFILEQTYCERSQESTDRNLKSTEKKGTVVKRRTCLHFQGHSSLDHGSYGREWCI